MFKQFFIFQDPLNEYHCCLKELIFINSKIKLLALD